MELPHENALDLIEPYIVKALGVNIFAYPGTREDFAGNLVNLGAGGCLIRFALRFEGRLIDLDLLFLEIDIVRTTDDTVIFYSPDSRVLDLKIIRRPG
ncbi:MAG TPA: hypothetical protein VK436_06935 [Methanocella sp.]|nr:hypothetical protein [Methanocella sp.]